MTAKFAISLVTRPAEVGQFKERSGGSATAEAGGVGKTTRLLCPVIRATFLTPPFSRSLAEDWPHRQQGPQ